MRELLPYEKSVVQFWLWDQRVDRRVDPERAERYVVNYLISLGWPPAQARHRVQQEVEAVLEKRSVETIHDCGRGYWNHCIYCVVGDPDAEIRELFIDDSGVCTEVEVIYPDESRAFLVRSPEGWHFQTEYRTDCVTATGMYDRL